MSCAACSARVENAVGNVSGVKSCSVSLLTNSMLVDGGSTADIIDAVRKAGYGASVRGSESKSGIKDTETPKLIKRLAISAVFLLVLMYFTTGKMAGLPQPSFLSENNVAQGLLQMFLASAVMVINGRFFVNGFNGLLHRSPNMDSLVAIGAGAAFLYSVIGLCKMIFVPTAEEHLYFESAAMILTLITVGKTLEARSKSKTADALAGLMRLSPETADIIKDGCEITVPVGEVRVGDIFAVRPGRSVPVDGTVIEGISAVNEAALTGESIPVDKKPGDVVLAATVNCEGYMKCRADKVGEDTELSLIIRAVADASATKAPISKLADRVSGIFVPVVMALALITAVIWLILGYGVGFALSRGISVLVISCPCALGLATPVAVTVGSGVGAKRRILFKSAAALEAAGRAEIAVVDKTGTVTCGEPEVTDVIPTCGDAGRLIRSALSLELKSEHPLAKAIVRYSEKSGIRADEITSFTALPGNGLSGRLGNAVLRGGKLNFIEQFAEVGAEVREKAETLSSEGKTPIFFSCDGDFLGMIAAADVIRPESPESVSRLRSMGIRVVMLTGDTEKTALAIAEKVGITEVTAGVLPTEKERFIEKLRSDGVVAMIGDGINDAPALTAADVGIAVGGGADIAADAADIVLMKSRLTDVPDVFLLSRAVVRNIRQNLLWAFIYNIIGIPLAAGIFIPFTGWELSPAFGALAMSLSSFCVISNALRLNLFNPSKFSCAGKKESKKMVVLKVEGMMCSHCEAAVKSALEAVPGVISADVRHKSGTAAVSISGEVPEALLISAVVSKGYKASVK